MTVTANPGSLQNGSLTRDQAKEEFDRQAQQRLGISGAEFLRKWDAGEYTDPDSSPDMMSIAMRVQSSKIASALFS